MRRWRPSYLAGPIALTMKAQNEKPEYKDIKEFAAFVVYLEDEGKTALFR